MTNCWMYSNAPYVCILWVALTAQAIRVGMKSLGSVNDGATAHGRPLR